MSIGRLAKKTEIDRVMKKGKSIRDAYCGIRFLKNELSQSRIAFIVGTKIDKRAVVRNRLRRQYRESVASLLKQMTGGFDILFFPSAQAIQISYEDQQKHLRAILEKHGIITP